MHARIRINLTASKTRCGRLGGTVGPKELYNMPQITVHLQIPARITRKNGPKPALRAHEWQKTKRQFCTQKHGMNAGAEGQSTKNAGLFRVRIKRRGTRTTNKYHKIGLGRRVSRLAETTTPPTMKIVITIKITSPSRLTEKTAWRDGY